MFAPETGPQVAVRAMQRASDLTWAYFDVRGPGVLVDPHDALGIPLRPRLRAGRTTTVPITVMNTGEATDTFEFRLTDLPHTWTVTPVTMTLAAGEEATAEVAVTVPPEAPVGSRGAVAQGKSATDSNVVTVFPFEIEVEAVSTLLVYTGAGVGGVGEPAGFAAQLTDFTTGEVVEGAPVTFRLEGSNRTQEATAITDEDGVAFADPVLTLPVGAHTVAVRSERFGEYGPGSGLGAYTVIDAGGAYSGAEGAAVRLVGTVPERNAFGATLTPTWHYETGGDVDAGATCTFADPANPITTVTCSDDGTFHMTLSASDGRGSGAATATLTLENVPPSIGDLDVPLDPVQVGEPVTVTVPFTDPGTNDTHTCSVDWGDGTASGGVVSYDAPGEGACAATHTYSTPDVHVLHMTVADDDGGVDSTVFEYLVAFDPDAGFVTGGGWIDSPPGAYTLVPTASGRANFGFVSRYQRGANTPEGNTQFRFRAGGFEFRSTSYDWLVVSGARAQYKGRGTVNGQSGYAFLLSAVDGDRPGGRGEDRLRLKVWNRLTGTVVYDNQAGDADNADASTAIGGGNIVVHTGA